MSLFASFTDFIRFAYENSPAARDKFTAAGLKPGDIQRVGDLPRLPVTRKSDLSVRQQATPPFGGFLAVPQERLQRVFASPGPIYDPQGEGEDYWRWGEALVAAGFKAGQIVQNTFSYHLTPAGFMFDGALRSLGCVVVPAGVGNTELQAQIMRDLRVSGYIGVPSFLYALVKKAEELGFVSELALRRAWITAERLSEELRTLLREEYGISVFQGYGTADTGCVAYECPEIKGLHLARDVVVEIVDPQTGQPVPDGEVGEIVITLMVPTYPLLRLASGDLSAFITEPCACGRPGKRLAGVLGRAAAGVKVRGLFLYPHQVSELAGAFPQVKSLRAVVTQRDFRDELTIETELSEGVAGTPELAGAIAARAKEILRLRAHVVFVPPGSIGEASVIDKR
ncbi:MAG: AMP-binding protein [Bacillota bacterium]